MFLDSSVDLPERNQEAFISTLNLNLSAMYSPRAVSSRPKVPSSSVGLPTGHPGSSGDGDGVSTVDS